MKHHTLVSRKPQQGQTFQAKMDFLVNLVDQMIEFIFNITR